jgi:Bacterial regulatory proteins, tetR family
MADLSLVAAHPEVSHRLDARGSQRARLVEGMIQAVAEKGYAAATVADAVRAARVSRGTFYTLFASKEECFLEAYKYGIDVIVDRIRVAIRAERGDWVARLRTGLRAYLETLAGEPRFARTHLFEVHAAGPRAGAERSGPPCASAPSCGCPPTTPSSSSRPASTSSCARASARARWPRCPTSPTSSRRPRWRS